MDILFFRGENNPFGSSRSDTHLKNWSRQFDNGTYHLQLYHHLQLHIKKDHLELAWWVSSMEEEEEAIMSKDEEKKRKKKKKKFACSEDQDDYFAR